MYTVYRIQYTVYSIECVRLTSMVPLWLLSNMLINILQVSSLNLLMLPFTRARWSSVEEICPLLSASTARNHCLIWS